MKKTWKHDFDIIRYTKAIELNPGDFGAYNNRGIAYQKRGDTELSIRDFSKAIELNPAFVQAYINRGNVYQETGQYESSITDVTRAIELQPWNSMAYNNRGFTRMLMGRYEEAELDIRKAIELSPNNIYALNSMAELCAARQDAIEACRWLRLAIEKGYNNWSYIRNSKTYDNIRNAACFKKLMLRK